MLACDIVTRLMPPRICSLLAFPEAGPELVDHPSHSINAGIAGGCSLEVCSLAVLKEGKEKVQIWEVPALLEEPESAR